MARREESVESLRGWLAIPARIEEALAGLTEQDLDLRGGAQGWSIRETAHHLVEACLVACGAVIAGLARSGLPYDWSWVTPDAAWMRHAGYSTAPVRPALGAQAALCGYVASLIRASADGPASRVRLLDAPGAKPYTRTVGDLLTKQIEHTDGHLHDVSRIRAGHGR